MLATPIICAGGVRVSLFDTRKTAINGEMRNAMAMSFCATWITYYC
jgi:hypothetical protein